MLKNGIWSLPQHFVVVVLALAKLLEMMVLMLVMKSSNHVFLHTESSISKQLDWRLSQQIQDFIKV